MSRIPKNKLYALGWYNEGIAHLKIHEYEEAMRFIDTALSAVPNHPDFLLGKGEIYLALGDYREAYEWFRMVVDEEPENFKAWLRCATSLLRMEKYKDALAVFKKARELNEDNGELWLGIGICLLNLSETDDANHALKKAIILKPNQPALWYYLAKASKDDKESLALLQRGHAMDPGNLDILLEMVRTYLRQNNFEEAGKILDLADSVAPGSTNVRRMIEYYMLETTWGEVFRSHYFMDPD